MADKLLLADVGWRSAKGMVDGRLESAIVKRIVHGEAPKDFNLWQWSEVGGRCADGLVSGSIGKPMEGDGGSRWRTCRRRWTR
ncbi:Transcriptional regulator [Caenorhabditis elegans]|uniref:Transcriptional regulator n=1 Tax=Caenorhabditis elegans TaxID=6239 RepID=I2HAF7_CAEEL|nr:Transcriptional regulator [Caenorhabditis elegans]NP_001294235.1 Transcriptional regulator [Caenorhabditis elegans]CCH63864.1 Transcriptional regulator [Caenorhabditis elegans]CCU83347.1 Transcriptional regulator [Caenorhabditis elegans]|eukprot:NP_001255655.1 Uncharacterized protein CELE_C26H9A.3 [Caenorhabditis elegans]